MNNFRNGLGLYFWDSGHIFVGYWDNDVINGNGVFYLQKGGYFFGKFIDGKANGYCQLVYQDGSSQQGIWKQGILQGKCLSLKNNEWKYEEYVLNSVKVSSLNNQTITKEMNLLSFILEKLFLVGDNTQIDQNQNAFRLYHQIYQNISIEVNFQDDTLFLLANTNFQTSESGFGILHHNLKPLIRGYFIDGKLNGIGCVLQEGQSLQQSQLNKGQYVDLGLQILDGIFVDGQFQYGIQYSQRRDDSQLCQVSNNQLFQMSQCKGFTEDILSSYKHPLRDCRFTIDKFTSVDLVTLSYLQNLQLNNIMTLLNSNSLTQSQSPKKSNKSSVNNKTISSQSQFQKSNSPSKKSNAIISNQDIEFNSLFKLTNSKQLTSTYQISEPVDHKYLLQNIQNRKRLFGDLKSTLEKIQNPQDNKQLINYVEGEELGGMTNNQNVNIDWKDQIIRESNIKFN